MKKYYTNYRITNIINQKIYIGAHETFNLKDLYMGSGKPIEYAIKKYGLNNFKREILSLHPNSEQMYEREKLTVDKFFINRTDTYNIKEGGLGGWGHINCLPKEKRPNLLKLKDMKTKGFHIGGGDNRPNKTSFTKESSKIASDILSRMWKDGKMENTRKKISISCTGKNNSQYGTHFYCDENGENRTRYKEGNQPKNWLTTIEFKRINMVRGTTFGKHWYNDGLKNYLRFNNDVKGLIKGRK